MDLTRGRALGGRRNIIVPFSLLGGRGRGIAPACGVAVEILGVTATSGSRARALHFSTSFGWPPPAIFSALVGVVGHVDTFRVCGATQHKE